MKKSDFLHLVKSTFKKPESVVISGKSVYMQDSKGEVSAYLVECKTEENAAKEMHKFNRWLSEALEEIHPSDTQWMPEEEKLKPGVHEAKINAVSVVDDKIVSLVQVGKNVISIIDKIHAVKKQKSPAKMFVRATMNILNQWDCFDSLKNPHWSNLSKKQKKSWARNFGIEMMECWIESCAMDLASDYKSEIPDWHKRKSLTDIEYYIKEKEYFTGKAKEQLFAELDYSSVEEYVEENLNCLW